MKKLINFGIISIIMIFSACDESYEMLTTIKKDGSCSREFTEKADSAFMVGDTSKSNPFPFFIDSTWNISWTHDSIKKSTRWPLKIWDPEGNEKEAVVYAKRNFATVESMASFDYLERDNWKSLKSHITFEKKFRWFYTYYYFEETFPKLETNIKVPITNYLTEKEAKIWLQGHADCFEGINGIEIQEYLSQIEEKFNRWLNRIIFEEYIHVIANNIKLLDTPGINAQRLLSAKDSIYNLYKKKETDFFLDFDAKEFDHYFDTNAFSKMFDKHQFLNQKVDSAFSVTNYFINQIDYHLAMPGKIISTNSSKVNSDTLYWKVDAYRFLLYKYDMYAESRTPNIWAFIVSGLLIVMAIWMFFIPSNKHYSR
jgi:hypothetical protein